MDRFRVFSGKTVVVSAAHHPLAHQLAVRLAEAGAMVVALGLDHAPSLTECPAMSGAARGRIEPLSLGLRRPADFAAVRRVLGNTPVDLLADFHTLTGPRHANLILSSVEALQPGLAAARGIVVAVGPAASPSASPQVTAAAAGFAAMVQALAERLGPLGIAANGLAIPSVRLRVTSADRLLVPLLALSRPDMRLVRGSVLTVSAVPGPARPRDPAGAGKSAAKGRGQGRGGDPAGARPGAPPRP